METLKIGDKIRVKNAFNDYIVEIVRVTKTQAIAKTPFNTEEKFKLQYGSFGPQVLPRRKWDTTIYNIIL